MRPLCAPAHTSVRSRRYAVVQLCSNGSRPTATHSYAWAGLRGRWAHLRNSCCSAVSPRCADPGNTSCPDAAALRRGQPVQPTLSASLATRRLRSVCRHTRPLHAACRLAVVATRNTTRYSRCTPTPLAHSLPKLRLWRPAPGQQHATRALILSHTAMGTHTHEPKTNH